MTTVTTLHAAVLSRLRALASLTVYAGIVPASPPSDREGRVLPYVVLWPSGGHRPAESRTLESEHTSDLKWRAHVTVAAGTVDWATRAVDLVRAALDGQVLAPFCSPLEEDGSLFQLLEDRDVTPARVFLPMSFVCTTG